MYASLLGYMWVQCGVAQLMQKTGNETYRTINTGCLKTKQSDNFRCYPVELRSTLYDQCK